MTKRREEEGRRREEGGGRREEGGGGGRREEGGGGGGRREQGGGWRGAGSREQGAGRRRRMEERGSTNGTVVSLYRHVKPSLCNSARCLVTTQPRLPPTLITVGDNTLAAFMERIIAPLPRYILGLSVVRGRLT
jgi:hypothetical protein